MLLQPDCIACIHRASLKAIRALVDDADLIQELVSEIAQTPALSGRAWNLTSPEAIEEVFRIVSLRLNDDDPFKAVKAHQNQRALELVPWLRTLIEESDDPLYIAANLAVMGNSLDMMWSEGSGDVESVIKQKMERAVSRDSFEEFRRRLVDTQRLLYLGDNCGEIVFDRLFIETIKKEFNVDVVFVVRSVPALNDATLDDAHAVGIHEVAAVAANGIDGPMPGTIPSRCSDVVRDCIRDTDLIISKGGGNFDSFHEYNPRPRDTFYLLMCKCVPYRDRFHTPVFHPILARGPYAYTQSQEFRPIEKSS